MPSAAPRIVVVPATAAGVAATASVTATAGVTAATGATTAADAAADTSPAAATDDTADVGAAAANDAASNEGHAADADGAANESAAAAANAADDVGAAAAADVAADAGPAESQPSVRRERTLSPEEQEIVINVYKYVKRIWPETRNSMSECTEKISDITGLSKTAVYRFLRDRRLSRPPLHELIDPETLVAIRRKIYRYYHEIGPRVPRPENILREVHDDPDLPNYSMSVFRRILHHLHYRQTVNQSRHDASNRRETSTIPVE